MDLIDDGNGGGGKEVVMAVSCSICLEAVTDDGDRSWAKLQCGHKFHLDCIGSAFNVKGAMQCPNCRKIEKGQWLYANGSHPLPEFSVDEWVHDEDYDLSYSEMSFGVHWCPFSDLTRLPSPFDEEEFSSGAYHDPLGLGHHAVFAEHTPMSSTSHHHCPYTAYIGPIHPSSSTSSWSVSDGSSFNNHWSVPAVSSEVPNSYVFPSMDVPYHSWDHSSQFAAIGGANQPSVNQRTSISSFDMPRPGMHPYIFGHSSAGRAPSSVTSSMLPPYPGIVSQSRDRTPSLHQPYYQQSNTNPSTRTALIPTGRRPNTHRSGLAQVAPIASSSDQSSGFYLFSSSSNARTFQETENTHRERFNVWEREHQQQNSFPLSQVDRDSSIWGPFHPPGGGSDTATRSSSRFRQRHGGGTERMQSQNRS